MNIDKKIIYSILVCIILSLTLMIVNIIITVNNNPIIPNNSDSFQILYDRLNKMEQDRIIEIQKIDVKLDSLNVRELQLSNELQNYNNNLKTSMNKIKKYKNEIIKHNYRDSSTISIVNRLNSNR